MMDVEGHRRVDYAVLLSDSESTVEIDTGAQRCEFNRAASEVSQGLIVLN